MMATRQQKCPQCGAMQPGQMICQTCRGTGFTIAYGSGWTPGTLLHEAKMLHDQVMSACFGEMQNKTYRNKHAIEMHVKVDRLVDEVTRIREDYPGDLSIRQAVNLLNHANDTILWEVFKLDPNAKQRIKKKEQPVAPTPLMVPDPHARPSVDSQFVDDDYATVTVSLAGREATGVAKRDPRDKPDQSIGYSLAYGRALRRIGGQIINEANQAVTAADKQRRKDQAVKDQARAVQRKAEAKARRERDEEQRVIELEAEVARLQVRVASEQRLRQQVTTRLGQAEAKEEARKARAAKKRAATRKATTQKRTTTKR